MEELKEEIKSMKEEKEELKSIKEGMNSMKEEIISKLTTIIKTKQDTEDQDSDEIDLFCSRLARKIKSVGGFKQSLVNGGTEVKLDSVYIWVKHSQENTGGN